MSLKEELRHAHVRALALSMATDQEIVKAAQIPQERLERYRSTIEAARAEGMVRLKFQRAQRAGGNAARAAK